MLRCELLTCHLVIVFWQMTKPQSFSVLLQLPSRQLESVFEVSTKYDLSGNFFRKVFRFLRWVHANYIMNWSRPMGAFFVYIYFINVSFSCSLSFAMDKTYFGILVMIYRK